MEPLLTINEVSQILRVPVKSIYAMVHEDKIPCIKLSHKRLRFKKSEIERWIESKVKKEKKPVRIEL